MTDLTSTVDTALWSVGEVSAYLRVPVKTLDQWRYLGRGPRAYAVGRHLRYKPSDVARWLDELAA